MSNSRRRGLSELRGVKNPEGREVVEPLNIMLYIFIHERIC